MPLENYRSQHNALVYLKEFPTIFFTAKSGGTVQNSVTQQFPGGGGPPVNVTGPTSVEQITLSKPYDAIRDAPLEVWSAAWDRGLEQSLTAVVQPVNSAGIPIGKADTYLDCARVSFKTPDTSRGSAEVAMLEVVVQPSQKI